jgi:Uma2 family endonuclease
MNETAERLSFTRDEYLAWEAEQPNKSEYVRGEVFAMTGASDPHNLVSGNLYMALRNRLRGGSCRVFMSDMKVNVADAEAFFYPDVFVTCNEGKPISNQTPLSLPRYCPLPPNALTGEKSLPTTASCPLCKSTC